MSKVITALTQQAKSIANTESKSLVMINDKTGMLLTSIVSKATEVKAGWKLITDSLVSSGIKSFMLDKTESGNKSFKTPYPELHYQINGYIEKGFSEKRQNVMNKDRKTLSDDDKDLQRIALKDQAAYFVYLKKQLVKREENKDSSDTEKSTPMQMYFKELESALDRLTKSEDWNLDVSFHTKGLKDLIQHK